MAGRDKIRLLIADDFEIIRNTIARVVAIDGDIEVVAEAANGLEAVEKACQLRPDVVLMDMRMPVMDGMQALGEIMRRCPTSVLMVSAFVKEGAEDALAALDAGAVDFVPKLDASGSMDIGLFRRMLLEKIRSSAQARPLPLSPSVSPPIIAQGERHLPADHSPHFERDRAEIDIVLIGASTGGPNALQTVIAGLPGDLACGVLIVQHMPAAFTGQLAARLNRLSALAVREASEGDAVEPGQVLLAPGDRHLVLRELGRVGLDEEPSKSLHRPSVDVLVHSGAKVYGRHALAVILTGMGEDGAQGTAALKECGGVVIAQDEATSVIYGMPRAVADLADEVCPLSKVAPAILSYL